jgi:hypothetical protein
MKPCKRTSLFRREITGTHMQEAVKNDKTASGTHNGKSYKAVTHLVTRCITVRS